MKNLRRIIVIGANGRLGAALAREYQGVFSVKAFARSQLDLGKLDQVRSTLSETEFDLLLNCAALTNVDYCESHSDEAFLINAQGPRLVAEICREKSAKLVHISTDYVFDGKQDTPYIEEDLPAPLSVYAESKLAGEREVLAVSQKNLVVRLSWVFGPDKPSFIDQIIQRARENETVTAVADKFSSPTYTIDVANWLRLAWDNNRHFASVQRRRVQLAGMGAICDRGLPQRRHVAEGRSRGKVVVGRHEKFRGATSGLYRVVDREIYRSYRRATPPLARSDC